MGAVYDIMKNEHDIKDETRERLAFMNAFSYKRKSGHQQGGDKLGNDINSTGSFLSDLSLTQSEEDFIKVKTNRNSSWRKHRPSLTSNLADADAGSKRTRLSQDNFKRINTSETKKVIEIGPNENIVAHTKVSVPQDDGPILAESIIHALPPQHPTVNLKATPGKNSAAKENISPNLFKTPTKYVER